MRGRRRGGRRDRRLAAIRRPEWPLTSSASAAAASATSSSRPGRVSWVASVTCPSPVEMRSLAGTTTKIDVMCRRPRDDPKCS